MKNFKLTKKVQIVLATILTIIVGIILVGFLANNKAMAVSAGDKCPDCSTGTLVSSYDSTGHGLKCNNAVCGSWFNKTNHSLYANGGYSPNKDGTHSANMKCSLCQYSKDITSSCSPGAWYHKQGTELHYKYCTLCGYYVTQANCHDDNGDGVCEDCGWDGMHVHSYSTSYVNNNNGTHTEKHTCSCGDSYDGSTVNCSYGNKTSNGNGTHSASCTVCGYNLIENCIGVTDAGKPATCTEEGVTEGKHCSVCGEILEAQQTIPALGHTEVIDEEKEATCTEKGLTEGKHCSVCGEILVAQEKIPAKGHNFVNGECTECGKQEFDEIDISSDTYKIENEYISKIQPETTVKEFKDKLQTNATEINIYNKENEPLKDDDIIGTGMKLELKSGDKTKTFTLIVKGDVNSDGKADMLDIVAINKYRLNKISLEEIYLKAGDATEDSKVDFYDILKINKFRLNKIAEL